MTAVETFVYGSIAHAKTLPLLEGIAFLQGFLEISSGTQAEPLVRQAHSAMRECDQQLELIASGQLKLAFIDREATTKARKPRR